MSTVYDKTEKGREEIATRKHRLPPRMRTLLVMIDGKRPADALMGDLGAFGLNEDSFEQLLAGEYIAVVDAPAGAARAPRRAEIEPVHEATLPDPLRAQHDDEPERLRALYDFFNQTIKSALGLRGIGLQLRVEKCATIEEFAALRLPYLEAVQKAKGREMALSLRDRLDQLLGGQPPGDGFLPI